MEYLYIYYQEQLQKMLLLGPLAGIEPAALRIRCSALSNGDRETQPSSSNHKFINTKVVPMDGAHCRHLVSYCIC